MVTDLSKEMNAWSPIDYGERILAQRPKLTF